jgi:Ca-activated chloride channel family protein
MISASAALFAFNSAFCAEEKKPTACNEDAMLVFDASGSMGGSVGLGVATPVTRIDKVRSALAEVLPSATRFRRVGLITYGPGPYQQCNVKLDLKPTPNAADLIMRAVNTLTPAGRTPLTSAVAQAADVLDFRQKPSLIVVVTDGEETCGGSPCDLGKQLHAAAEQLTIHVIGYRPKGFSWTGEQSLVDAKCLADQNGGLLYRCRDRGRPDLGSRKDPRLPDGDAAGLQRHCMSAAGTSATFKRRGSMSASGLFSDIRAWPAYVAE